MRLHDEFEGKVSMWTGIDGSRSSRSRSECRLAGTSPAIQELRRDIAAAARTSATVLLTGETGVGKGLVAREIHRLSRRRFSPLVRVDCAALPAGVFESELFGHERGAFTGADARRRGRFERAADGTIFLDEIGDLPFSLQGKLLGVLQEREYERVGGASSLRMRARVIAATNRDLASEVRAGRFRVDLLFRLSVLHVRVPALRERVADIPELVRVGLGRLREHLLDRTPALTRSFLHRLMDHDWPGNVRELMNLLERLAARRPGAAVWDETALEGALLQFPPTGSHEHLCGHGLVADGRQRSAEQRERIAAALRAQGGNVSAAARLLGIPRSTLRYRMRVHGLVTDGSRPGAGEPRSTLATL